MRGDLEGGGPSCLSNRPDCGDRHILPRLAMGCTIGTRDAASFESPLLSGMATRRRSDEDDERTARGLREDALDDALRKAGKMSAEEWRELTCSDRFPHQLRAIEDYSADPADWLRDP